MTPEPAPPAPKFDLIRYLEASVSRPIKVALSLAGLVSMLTTGFLAVDNLYVRKSAFAKHERGVAVRLDRSDLRGVESERTFVTGEIFQLERHPTLSTAESTFLNQLRNRQAQIDRDITDLRARLLMEEEKL